MPPSSPRRIQPELFPATSPLVTRLGGDFFKGLPRSPGVYFFYGEDDRLLYIGQSGSLRDRIGSYRFVSLERHPKRLTRLIHHTRRIEWQICGSAPEAISLEASLLMARKPPFNRAGVWKPPPCWLEIRIEECTLHLRLAAETSDEPSVIGPLPGGFRYTFAAMARLLYAQTHPGIQLWEFPIGMLKPVLSPHQTWILSEVDFELIQCAGGFIRGECVRWLEDSIYRAVEIAGSHPFWTDQLDLLQKFDSARRKLVQASLL